MTETRQMRGLVIPVVCRYQTKSQRGTNSGFEPKKEEDRGQQINKRYGQIKARKNLVYIENQKFIQMANAWRIGKK